MVDKDHGVVSMKQDVGVADQPKILLKALPSTRADKVNALKKSIESVVRVKKVSFSNKENFEPTD